MALLEPDAEADASALEHVIAFGDPLAALVLCGAHEADRVMVAGEWKVEDTQPLHMDVAKLRHEHGEASKAFLESI